MSGVEPVEISRDRWSLVLSHGVAARAATAIGAIADDRSVVVIDSSTDTGALVFAARSANNASVAFAVRHTSGYLSVAMAPEHLRRLAIPDMPNSDARPSTDFVVSVDARQGISTGISAADRARTIAVLASAETTSSDLTRPGHVAPVRTEPSGVLGRAEIAEAAADLTRLAGHDPVAAFAHLVSAIDDRGLASREELVSFAMEHSLAWCTIGDLIAYRRETEELVRWASEAAVPTAYGRSRAVAFTETQSATAHLAIVYGDIDTVGPVLTSVHRECVLCDVFGSTQCDCRLGLNAAHDLIGGSRKGVLLYLRDPQAGRGAARRTSEVESALVAQMLAQLGVRSVQMIVNDPSDRWELERFGVNTVQPLNVSSIEQRKSAI